MVTNMTISFGRRLIVAVAKVDFAAVVGQLHPEPPYAIALRFTSNTCRALYAWIAWIAVWAITFPAWQIGSHLLKALSPGAAWIYFDVMTGVVVFAGTGFSLFFMKVGFAYSSAERETRRAKAKRLAGAIEEPRPSLLQRLALKLTTPSEYDLVLPTLLGFLAVFVVSQQPHG
jgi:hypothetical protein